jgi:hypothetical protein
MRKAPKPMEPLDKPLFLKHLSATLWQEVGLGCTFLYAAQ